MNFLFIDNLLRSDLPGVLVNVFLHSLWQGAALCVLAWLCLKFIKKWSPQSRYNLLVFFFFTFAISIVFTLYSQLAETHHSLVTSISGNTPAGSSVSEDRRVLVLIAQWFQANANWIFLLWCFIFLFKANQMVRDLVTIERLKKFAVNKITSQWKERFDELRVSLGIKKNVGLSESNIVSQPVVVGILKPLILVPVGFLNGLNAGEVEAILLHELAHVRRNDYLVNLLQSIMEIIFFFNPFVYWLSALIRNEREHCCDAIAIEQSGSKKVFLDALLSVQLRLQSPSYAMGFLGRKSQFAQRVDRIISFKNKNVSAMEKLVVITCYMLLFVTLVSFTLLNNQTVSSEKIISSKTLFRLNPTIAPSALKKEIKDEKFVKVNKPDTFPKNASKEFIAGYRAAKNYEMETALKVVDTTNKKIEEIAAGDMITEIPGADKVYPKVHIIDANEKKRLEEAMIALKKNNK